ncbi:hypothetical protein DICPUDRAFT_78293 [Dictyostelium purpureum]|uniref:mRNA-decapping enzyme-like protein n=1 Tax=Dictyostelium purpureum TaxID=5786 RepID=F0ZJ48_DICPU|nr:uncharacterized protein DICPUDRAFT_78293 [Dictyostelium purpureum]EGC36004.1 hypothetical protein DICPUDRAFT_78293 [Dictyostelium purpureum]|eukprot:XP_003287442.1 hypothetical protein DICPUDRAFT_78293 [Dictyostelium purpureum]
MASATIESQQQNLSALQRLDNKVLGILGTSTHATAYRFDETLKQWSRKDIEGSLFVVNRSEFPYCKLIIMNRLSTKNLCDEIYEKMVIKCQDTYLIYRNKNEEICGIWFYEPSDQEKIFNLLKEVQKNPPLPPQQPPQPPQQPQQSLPPHQQQQSMIPPPGFMMHQHPQYMSPHPPHTYQPPYNMQMAAHPSQNFSNSNPSTPNKENNIQPSPPQQINKNNIEMEENIITPNTLMQQTNSTKTSQPVSPSNGKKEVPLLSVLMNSVVIKENTVTKDQIRETLKRLANDDNFIDLVYNAYINE